jgi:hypothetical protein
MKIAFVLFDGMALLDLVGFTEEVRDDRGTAARPAGAIPMTWPGGKK